MGASPATAANELRNHRTSFPDGAAPWELPQLLLSRHRSHLQGSLRETFPLLRASDASCCLGLGSVMTSHVRACGTGL